MTVSIARPVSVPTITANTAAPHGPRDRGAAPAKLASARPIVKVCSLSGVTGAIERCQGEALDRARNGEALWSLTEAYLTLHGSSGMATTPRTLKAYRWAVNRFLDYSGSQAVNLLRATSGDGVRFVRSVEAGGLSASSTRVQLAGVRLLYSALRWAGATEAAPFSDVRPVADKTPAWDKRVPYSHAEI